MSHLRPTQAEHRRDADVSSAGLFSSSPKRPSALQQWEESWLLLGHKLSGKDEFPWTHHPALPCVRVSRTLAEHSYCTVQHCSCREKVKSMRGEIPNNPLLLTLSWCTFLWREFLLCCTCAAESCQSASICFPALTLASAAEVRDQKLWFGNKLSCNFPGFAGSAHTTNSQQNGRILKCNHSQLCYFMRFMHLISWILSSAFVKAFPL